MADQTAPVLSTPAENVFETPIPSTAQTSSQLSEEQLYLQYEIARTISEIRAGKWRRIALQFPDDMLADAPRVFERLRDGLNSPVAASTPATIDVDESSNADVRLCILADTSYGACCVDEVAAEHIDADVIVHYGRSCLSPTARLPVIYVFTTRPLEVNSVVETFKTIYSDPAEKVCLMADIPYEHHLEVIDQTLREQGYLHVFKTAIVRDPSSLLPNRTVPDTVREQPDALKDYSIFHISSPPPSLLLTLSSRVKNMHIYPTDTKHIDPHALEVSTTHSLRRRYALVVRLSTVAIFGILINTLSVANYMDALQHCQDLISKAGKKSYVFVVGKVNAAKVANFSEIGGWVVIGCWESSLIESKDFYRPIITPFELEVALTNDRDRVWGGEWTSDFASVLRKKLTNPEPPSSESPTTSADANTTSGNWDDEPSDDEPPEFDLRTGKYVSHTRPMARGGSASTTPSANPHTSTSAPTSRALALRGKGEIATIGGQVSPAAEYLRAQRTWQGLGSDHQGIAYERDEHGRIQGAEMREGRSGLAQGYAVGEDQTKT